MTYVSFFNTLKTPCGIFAGSIVFLVVSATISGCEGWKSIKDFGDIKLNWLRQFLPYEEGIPVDDTIARVMRRLDTKAFQSCFMRWMQAVSSTTNGDIVAIDGKRLRRSYDKVSEQSPIHMVSAWSTTNGVVLGQEKTAEKSNEITAIPELLDVLALRDCIVTIDAMGCQRDIAQQIKHKQADYVLALKGNQGHLHEETSSFFAIAQAENFSGIVHDFYEEQDAGHGRVEHRQCWVIDPKHYAGSFRQIEQWPSLVSLVMMKTTREMPDKITQDMMCQPFSGHEIMQFSEPVHIQREINNHWLNAFSVCCNKFQCTEIFSV